jgi:hypothetical protein
LLWVAAAIAGAGLGINSAVQYLVGVTILVTVRRDGDDDWLAAADRISDGGAADQEAHSVAADRLVQGAVCAVSDAGVSRSTFARRF